MQNNRSVGTTYEKVAGEYLQSLGYEILEYNYRCRQGEVDIVAWQGEYLVFVEVKYRRTDHMGQPLEAITFAKQKKICRCARQYLYQHRMADVAVRFDVVSILGDEICVIPNAFEFLN